MPRRNPLGPKPRPSRRRIVATVLLVLFAAVLIAEVVHDDARQSSAVGRRAATSWVAGVEPILASSSAIAPALATIERDPIGISRLKLDSALEALSETVDANQLSLVDLGIESPSSTASKLAVQVLNYRQSVVAATRQMLVAATGVPHQSARALTECLNAQSALRQSDSALATLRRLFNRVVKDAFSSAQPWAAELPRLQSPGCGNLVAALSSNAGLVVHRSLKLVAISVLPNPVQINGVPNPTTTTTTSTLPASQTTTTTSTSTTTTIATQSGTTTTSTTSTTLPPVTTTTSQIPPVASRSVLPPTTTLTVEVVVQNSGNSGVGPVLVSVEVVDSSSQLHARRAYTTSALAPGGAQYVTFNDLPLGKITGRFVLRVSASATGAASTHSSITLVRSPR